MSRLRYTLLSIRDLVFSLGPLVALVGLLLWGAFAWLQPTPPRTLVLATGPEQSAYDMFGHQYAQALAAYGIAVQLLPTDGTADNLALLRTGRADVGFVQGGSGTLQRADRETLQTLGSLFVEPLWVFYHEASAQRLLNRPEVNHPRDLRGWRINVGTAGSGVPNLFRQLLEVNQIDMAELTLSEASQTPATMAFLAQDVDAIVFVSAPDAPMVQMLLQTPGVRLMNFAQARAYAARFGFLTPVELPQGVVNMAAPVPEQDIQLIASTTSLLASTTTHPALLQLLAQTAQNLHSPAGWFNRHRQFPNFDNAELPVAAEAERTVRNGTPFLQRYLPFWMANLVERMWLALGLIVALVLPLSRLIPPIYSFRVRSRVFRWYAELRRIEQRAEALSPPDIKVIDQLIVELDQLETQVEGISLPLAYTDELYTLRHHIDLIRKRLRRMAMPALDPAQAMAP